MNPPSTTAFQLTGSAAAPIRRTPKIDVRHLAEGDHIPRGHCGVLRISGRRRGTYKIESDAVCIEHSLFGCRVTQTLPIVPAPLGAPREQLACRCGAARNLFYARPGVGFLCAKCAAKFCDSANEARLYQLRHEQGVLQRRWGIRIDRDGWASYRSTRLSPEERAKLNAQLEFVSAELKRLQGGLFPKAGSGILGLGSHVGSESVEVET